MAEHQSEYALSTLQRTGRDAGLGMDEIALAREFDSDEKEAALLRFVKALLESDGPPSATSTRRRARPAGTSRSSRRSPTSRSRPSGTSSRGPATCPGTAPVRTPGSRAAWRVTMSVMASRTVVVRRQTCCTEYHHAVELVGKRWTGAILFVLMDGPTRFSEFKRLVPDLSDRLLSERMKELGAGGSSSGA